MSTTSTHSFVSSGVGNAAGEATFVAAMRTDVGRRRTENQDSYGFLLTETGSLYIVADGMGGARGGGTASAVAVNIIIHGAAEKSGNLSLKRLRRAIHLANQVIFDRSKDDAKLAGMGTTVVALALIGRRAVVAHVGDSRIYLNRQGRLHQLTRDHTLVQELVDTGAIAQKDAASHPIAHMLTRSLGPAEATTVEIHELPDAVQAGDKFLLCSDGLYNHVSNDEIGEVLAALSPEKAVETLLQRALDGGGSDNVTIQVIEVAAANRKGSDREEVLPQHFCSSEVEVSELPWFSPEGMDSLIGEEGGDDWDGKMDSLHFGPEGEVLARVRPGALNGGSTSGPTESRDMHSEEASHLTKHGAKHTERDLFTAPKSSAGPSVWRQYGAPISVAAVAVMGLLLFLGGEKPPVPPKANKNISSMSSEKPPPAAKVQLNAEEEREALTKEMLGEASPVTDSKDTTDTPSAEPGTNQAETKIPAVDNDTTAVIVSDPTTVQMADEGRIAGDGITEEELRLKEQDLLAKAEVSAKSKMPGSDLVETIAPEVETEMPAEALEPAEVPLPEEPVAPTESSVVTNALPEIPKEVAQQLAFAANFKIPPAPRIVLEETNRRGASPVVPIVWEHEQERVVRLLSGNTQSVSPPQDGAPDGASGDRNALGEGTKSKLPSSQDRLRIADRKAEVRDRIADIDAKLQNLLVQSKEEAAQRVVRMEMESVRAAEAMAWANKEREEAIQLSAKWEELDKRRAQLEFTALTDEVANISSEVKKLRQDYLKLTEDYLRKVESSQSAEQQPEAAAQIAALGRQVKLSRQALESEVLRAIQGGARIAREREKRAERALVLLERRWNQLNRHSGFLRTFIPLTPPRQREFRKRYLDERSVLAKNLAELTASLSDEDEMNLRLSD